MNQYLFDTFIFFDSAITPNFTKNLGGINVTRKEGEEEGRGFQQNICPCLHHHKVQLNYLSLGWVQPQSSLQVQPPSH